MKLFRYITGSLFVLISVVVMFKFDAVSNFFLFLSPDKVVESYTLLMMWICFISLSSVGFCLLLYDYIIKLIVVIDRRLMSLDVKSFIKYFLLIGFALRLAVILFMPLHLWGDWESYDDMGWQWALKGDYFNGDHLTSYWPPGYPFFLSRLYLIFGHEPIAATAVNIFFSLAIVFLSYLIIRRIWNEQVSRWTMLILIFFPSQILFTNLLATEMLFTSLLLLSIYVFISLNDNLEGKWYFALLGGILLGFASLTRPIAKLYLPLVISFWYFQTRNVKSTVKYSLFALMGFLLTVTPWLIRNYSAFGRARINYNTGINLYIGNQPASGMGYNTYIATEFDSNQPDMEAYVDSLTTHRALQYIIDEPLAFIKRGVFKVGLFYATDFDPLDFEMLERTDNLTADIYTVLSIVSQSYYMIILLSAFLGIFTVYLHKLSWRKPEGYLLWVTILYWTGVHFVFFGIGRFHFPIIPMIASFAALYLTSKISNTNKIN